MNFFISSEEIGMLSGDGGIFELSKNQPAFQQETAAGCRSFRIAAPPLISQSSVLYQLSISKRSF